MHPFRGTQLHEWFVLKPLVNLIHHFNNLVGVFVIPLTAFIHASNEGAGCNMDLLFETFDGAGVGFRIRNTVQPWRAPW